MAMGLSVLINQIAFLNFCLCFCYTGINLRGMLHHVCDVAYDKNRCGSIRTCTCRDTSSLINYMALFGFKDLNYFSNTVLRKTYRRQAIVSQIMKLRSGFTVNIYQGALFCEKCFRKFYFFKKCVTNLFSWISGRIRVIVSLFKNDLIETNMS